MNHLLREIRHNPQLWLLAFVPVLFVPPVLILPRYLNGPTPMDLRFWPGVVVMLYLLPPRLA
jgi:hypothetical protein